MRIKILLLSIIFLYHVQGYAQLNQQDSLALVDLYHSTNGPEWTVNSNWLTNMPVSTWHGINTDNGRVYSINLYNNNLSGQLPESIGDLSFMRWIELSSNHIGGQIPESISNLVNLQSLSIQVNELEGTFPASMSAMIALKAISAYRNSFSGEFPNVLLSLTGLESLEISENMFHGPIPPEINNLTNLTLLSLASNQFSDTIPYLGDLQKITELHLRINQLEGDPSAIFRYMPNLYYLTLSYNLLSGSLPDTIFNPEKIQYLDIDENFISDIGDFSVHGDTRLSRFRVMGNKLAFEDLEPNRKIGQFFYYPQKDLLSADTIMLEIGDSVRIESGSAGQFTHYSWYKDNELIQGEEESTLFIANFSTDHAGVYHAEMSNDSLPLLVLNRNPVVLMALTTAIAEQTVGVMKIFPNPADEIIHFSEVLENGMLTIYSTQGTLIKTWRVDNPTNQFHIGFLPDGHYMIRFASEEKSLLGKIVKL